LSLSGVEDEVWRWVEGGWLGYERYRVMMIVEQEVGTRSKSMVWCVYRSRSRYDTIEEGVRGVGDER